MEAMGDGRGHGRRSCDGCGKPAETNKPLKSCSICHAAWYHNVICQRKHYKVHRKTCSRPLTPQNKASPETTTSAPSVQIVRREGRGRCLIASDHLPEQTRIGQLHALIPPVLFRSQQHQRCAVCFCSTVKPTTTIPLEESRHFLNAQYTVNLCSKLCKDTFHRHGLDREMSCVSKLPAQCKLLPTALLLYRIMVQSENDPTLRKEMEELEHHTKPPFDLPQDERIHTTAITYLVERLLKAHRILNQQDTTNQAISQAGIVEQLLSKLKTNCFTISQGFLAQEEAIGIGLFASPGSAINHSCVPNAAQSFAYGGNKKGEFPSLWVTTTTTIEAGQEVCISYLDTRMKTHQRKETLLQNYYFECKCRRCENPTHSDFPDKDYQACFEKVEEFVYQLLQHNAADDTKLRNVQEWMACRCLTLPPKQHDIFHHMEMKCRVAQLRGLIASYRSADGNPLQSIHQMQEVRTILMQYFPPSHDALVAVEDVLRMFCP